MADATSTKWIKVNDFSPGIMQAIGNDANSDINNQAAASPLPLGSAASVDSSGNPVTFDCIAYPGGALGAIPFNFFTGADQANPAPDSGTKTSVSYASAGMHVLPYKINGQEAVFYSMTYTDLIAGVQRRKFRVFYQLFDSFGAATPPVELQTPAGATPLYTSALAVATPSIYGFGILTDYRSSSPAAATTPGSPLLVLGYHDPSLRSGTTWKFPGALLHRVANYAAINDPIHLVSHQGRLLVNGNHVQYLIETLPTLHNDDNFWTVPNQDAYDNGGADSSFSQATLGSYGVIVPQSASELLIIRTTPNGGMTISSDLNDPIITDYATMQGTNGIHVEGCWTPIGYVYPTGGGSVYAYIGGGQTKDIAPQMDWGFWDEFLPKDQGQASFGVTASQEFLIPQMGKCAYVGDYVLVPGNWCFQISTNTWWRFRTQSTTSDIAHQVSFNGKYFEVGPAGNMYCQPQRFNATTDPILMSSQFGLPTTVYAWQSNLIPIAEGSDLGEVREFILEGIPYGNGLDTDQVLVAIKVYPSGETYNLPAFIFNTALENQEPFRVNTPSLKGTHAVVTLFAANLPVAGPAKQAPTVTSFQLGVGPGTKIKNAA